ncbi:MAG: hypothetical protein GX639_09385 [Fibrobacter sp.]|nr:hypothetical protein [Fibrobacter sp.]
MRRLSLLPMLMIIMLSLTTFTFAQSGIYSPDPNITANGTVRAVVIHDSILYVGGNFTKVTDNQGSYARKGLAAFNLVTGRVTAFKADINRGVVRAIAVDDSMVYTGGTFTKINNISRSKVAALDPVTGDVIPSFSSTGSLINGPVFALCCLDKKLFVGGNFTQVNGIERSYLAALDMKTGLLDSSFNPSPRDSVDVGDNKMDGGVTTIEVHPANSSSPGILFVGGNFQTVTGVQNSKFLVALRSDGSPGPEFKKGPNYPPIDIYCRGTTLFAGLGGLGNRPAAYDIGSTRSYTELWKGIVVKGDVQAITCSDSGFVFFSFHQGLFDTTDHFRCAVINEKDGQLYDTLPSISSFFGVWALDTQKDILVAGGAFTSINGKKQNHLAVFKIPSYPVQSIPSKVVLTAPLDVTIVTSRTPKLQWKFVPYADNYDVQVATDSLFENRLASYTKISTFTKRCSQLKRCSRYFWRARANNQSGVGPWSTVWQFFTEPGDNDIPRIVKPTDGAEYLPVSFNCIWRRAENALSYTIEVAEDERFTTVLFNSGDYADTTVLISNLANDKHYFLRVRSNTIGGPTGWDVVGFSTVPAAPDVPLQIIPADNALRVNCLPVFSWQKVSDATSYRLQLSTDSCFTNSIIDTTGHVDTTFTSPELSSTTRYFWRVGADNTWGSSPWSVVRSFTTGNGSRTIVDIITPIDRSISQLVALKCVWHPVASAYSYTVQVSQDQNFTTTIVDITDIPDTMIDITGLSNGTHYYLRVGAVTDSDAGVWSYISFTTVCSIPGVPVGKTPENNAILVTCNPELIWKTVSGAASYRVQLSSDSTFTTTILDSTGLIDTSITISQLSMDTRYFWRVNASNDGGETWSLPMRFTTLYSAPYCPLALFPQSGYASLCDSVKIVWSSSSPHITDYLIEVAYDSTMNNPFISGTTTDTSYSIHRLSDNKRIFWRVKARNIVGESNCSVPVVFKTSFPAILRYSLNTFNFYRGFGHLSYSVAKQSDVVIRLFNLRGKVVWKTKLKNVNPGHYTEIMPAGALSAGYYIVKIKAGTFTRSAGAMITK